MEAMVKLRFTGKFFAGLLVCLISLSLFAQSDSTAKGNRTPAKENAAAVAEQVRQLRQMLNAQQQRIAQQQNQIQQLQQQLQESNSQLQQQAQRLQAGAEQALRDLAARNLQLQELKGEVSALQERFGRPSQ